MRVQYLVIVTDRIISHIITMSTNQYLFIITYYYLSNNICNKCLYPFLPFNKYIQNILRCVDYFDFSNKLLMDLQASY